MLVRDKVRVRTKDHSKDKVPNHKMVRVRDKVRTKVKDHSKDKDLKVRMVNRVKVKDHSKDKTKDPKVRDSKTPKTKVKIVAKVDHNNRVDRTKVRVKTKDLKGKVPSRVKDLNHKAVRVRDNRVRMDNRDKAAKVRDSKTPKTKVKVSPRINRTKVRVKVRDRWMNTQLDTSSARNMPKTCTNIKVLHQL